MTYLLVLDSVGSKVGERYKIGMTQVFHNIFIYKAKVAKWTFVNFNIDTIDNSEHRHLAAEARIPWVEQPRATPADLLRCWIEDCYPEGLNARFMSREEYAREVGAQQYAIEMGY